MSDRPTVCIIWGCENASSMLDVVSMLDLTSRSILGRMMKPGSMFEGMIIAGG